MNVSINDEETEDENDESGIDLTPKEGLSCNEVGIDSAVTETGRANSKPTYHVFKHKFNIPLSESVSTWYMQVSYPHPLFEIDTWGNYETEGNANDWTIISTVICPI